MKKTLNVTWLGEQRYLGTSESGHQLLIDNSPVKIGVSPMEALLGALATCTAYDVVLILKRGRHDVTGCEVKMSAERAPVDPKVFTRIQLHFKVSGRHLPEAAVARAIELSHEKYCSATIMLAKTAEVTTSFEIVNA